MILQDHFFKIDNTDADLANNAYLLDLEYTDDGQANADFLKCSDNNGDIKFSIQEEGNTAIAGTLAVTGQIIGDTINMNLLDAVGAVDMDYGSVDITDHTFTTDDSTFIIDGGITVSTGDTNHPWCNGLE